MEEAPFPDLQIESTDFLGNLTGRSKCPNCRKSRKYYCYTCYKPIKEIEDRVPKVKLPIKVDIIKHPSECDGKSTAVHAGVICPEDVTIHTFPCIPDYSKEKTVLVFPSERSVTLKELEEKLGISRKCRQSLHQTHINIPDSKTVNSKCVHKHAKSDNDVNIEKDDKDDNCTVGLISQNLDKEDIKANDKEDIKASDISFEQTLPFPDASDRVIASSSLNEQRDSNDLKSLETKKNNYSRTSDTIVNGEENGTKIETKVSWAPFDRVVFIDSTWNQTRSICNDERLKDLQCVELKTRTTKFWRHQDDVPDTYLSTIEAVYYFMRDFHDIFMTAKYDGEYDNLLFFFTFMYRKIRTIYDGGEELKAYKKRKVTQNEDG